MNSTTEIATSLLKRMIAAPSLSSDEKNVSDIVAAELTANGYAPERIGNNLIVKCKDFAEGRPTLMLNSHLDTVKPAQGWATDPFLPVVTDGKIYGLGSNDAGASLVSLLAAFIATDNTGLPYNRLFVASAEEEISGPNGMYLILPQLKTMVTAGIVGEPTGMKMAIAEKGLLVLDCEAEGKTGHAARADGINAISIAMKDIEWLHTYQFPEKSPLLGNVKMTVTQIQAGTQHNVIPASCKFVVDVRTTEKYSNRQTWDIIQQHIKSVATPRSLNKNASAIDEQHPIVVAAHKLGIETFFSPTTSDQAVISGAFPTVKMGPGDSARSHTANEFIAVSEIESGIEGYIELLKNIAF
ncbi:MAG: M20/M25/M40 family metallo-hydrolase [Salinivirgaceae bacterium]|nr:M20/M25/M40 family metallo-hydrolase [Salinivirgaceae bacterium]